MSLAQLIRDMSAAGAPAEAIALAVDAIEQAQAVVEQRRAVERDRKRRQRDRERDSHGTVTGQSGDVTDEAPLSRPPNEIKSNPPTHTPPDMTTRPRKADPFPKPEWAAPQHWADFLENRKRKKLANTASAYAKFLADIDRHSDDDWPPGRVLEHAAASGWAGIYNPRESQENGRSPLRTQNNITSLRGARPNSALDMVIQAERELQAEAERENPGADWSPRLALPSG